MTLLVIGGCAYRSSVHCAHAASLTRMASFICSYRDLTGKLGGYSMHIDYQHTSNLPQGRSLWLRRAIGGPMIVGERPRMAISVDSDTAFDGIDLMNELPRMTGTDVAIGIAPVIRVHKSSTALNIYHAEGETILPSACGAGSPSLWAGGFGLAVFNLQWFRKHWPLPGPEPFGDKGTWISQGEDIQMCRSVASRGGKIIPLWIGTTHYDSSGTSITGGKIGYHDGRMICDE